MDSERHNAIYRHKTETSIRNNDYVRLQYEDYYLQNTDILKNLKPVTINVESYWLPESNGEIAEAYLYQAILTYVQAIKYRRYIQQKWKER